MLLLREPTIPKFTNADVKYIQERKFGGEEGSLEVGDPCFDEESDDDEALETFVTRRHMRRLVEWVWNSIFSVHKAIRSGQKNVDTSDPLIQYSLSDALLYCAQAASRVQAAASLFPGAQDHMIHTCVPLRDAYRLSCMVDDGCVADPRAMKKIVLLVEHAEDMCSHVLDSI